MPVLGLDTSTRTQSVAVVAGGAILSQSGTRISGTHSESILTAVDRALSSARLRTPDLTLVAVTSGPGSFTGLRIGMATAKGLSLAAGIPLAGFSTLEIMAIALASATRGDPSFRVCPLIEAGRGQVYRGYFAVERDRTGALVAKALDEERVCLPEDALTGIGTGAIIGGDGAVNYRDRLVPAAGEPLIVLPAPFLATSLALRAEALIGSDDPASRPLVPNYVRPPDALNKARP